MILCMHVCIQCYRQDGKVTNYIESAHEMVTS